MLRTWWLATGVAATLAMPAAARDVVVRDQPGFAAAVRAARAGDTIVLADGEWRDFAAELSGEGTAGRPITLTAQTPGKVILTGRSSLRLAGRHLVVANLVFRDGHAPGDEVVATRIGRRWAEDVRLTGIVIDRFSNPDRRFEDHWVALYGRGIRVDHSHFVGKANAGAMLVVIRERQYPLENRITLDHNYFGPRPVLGSNGGETIRIGTSTESLSDSHSVVEDNWFEHCDGEVEIVSIKSGGNVIRRNVIVDSQGAVVLRHGNGNLVERNVFLGHGLKRTGGIRVINERQTVRGNYLEGLGGIDFTSAITVMNGVPNSPINRYMPVRDALIERNSVIDAAQVTLGAGASAERSAAPQTTRFVANLFVNRDGRDPFRAEASLTGIDFSGNVANIASKVVTLDQKTVTLTRADNGLLYPTDSRLADIGASRDLAPIARAATGVAWYPKPEATDVAFGRGQAIAVTSGGALLRAVSNAGSGDVIRLAGGRYDLAQPLVIDRTLTLRGTDATLAFSAPTLFQLAEGGNLRLEGLAISGASAPARRGNAVIRTAATPTLGSHAIELIDCDLSDMAGVPGFDVIATTPATLVEHVTIRGGRIADVSGAVLAAHSETGKEGYYNVEDATIAGTHFIRVGAIADLFRGGTDESTYGPRFAMTGATVSDGGALVLSGVQDVAIRDNRFVRGAGVEVTHSAGSPHTVITGNVLTATPAPAVRELYYKGPPRALIADNRSTG